LLVEARTVYLNPSPEELRSFTEEMPECRITEFGNVNVQTRVTSRSAGSTFVVTDDPASASGKTMTREEYARIASMQDAYLAKQDVVVIDGAIGNDESFRTPARLTIEKANANIAGMQQKLYFPVNGGEKVFLIIGLSGTGKTTTTFTTQNDSLPVQDDFVALMPGGKVYGTENGCFAKTFSLDPDFEPNIFRAVTQPTAYLENVYQDNGRTVNFFETSYTKNGRAVFGMDDLGSFRDARTIGSVDRLLILNWNENIIPAVVKLSQEQAAAYFMLGETTGTSAGGKAEEGKFLRVPGTNPFFPMPHGLQGNRILELLASHPLEVFLLNTGRVGGREDDERSKKVKIPHSSAVVKAIAEGTIDWTEDPDFGYLVAEAVPGIEDPELLQPRRLYGRQGRQAEYADMVARFKAERRAHLLGFPELSKEIVAAVG
jgi:phosphoenolpyruvate carboxykinase (ATP)